MISMDCRDDDAQHEREGLLNSNKEEDLPKISPPQKGSRSVSTRGFATLAAVVGAIAVVASSCIIRNSRRQAFPPAALSEQMTDPCHRPRSSHNRSNHEHQYYQPIEGSFELFQQNGIICPGQTAADLRDGAVAWATPSQWFEHRQATQPVNSTRRGGFDSWDGKGSFDTPYQWLQHRQKIHVNNWNGKGPGRGLIVFKRGGSGSTWFDTLLGNRRDLDFRHEAHHHLFKLSDTQSEATEIMRDFLQGGKDCKSEDGYCGFSISPTKHAKEVDFGQLIRETGATLVVFLRTNIVKRMVGLRRKEAVKALPKKCYKGSSYRVGKEDASDCKLNNSVDIELSKVLDIDQANFMQSWDLLIAAMETGSPFQILTYEGMQQNVALTFERLEYFSRWPLAGFHWERHSRTAKVTSEDLRVSISNYDMVEKALQEKPCFLDMLRSESQQMFPLCYSQTCKFGLC